MAENRLSLLGRDMAVDLGTANTLVYVRGRGIVLNEPSVVAVDIKDGRPLAVGAEAKRMIGRTPSNIQAIRPLKDGVIADFEICEKMLRYFIHRVHQRRFAKPRMVICVPSGITGVERRAVMEAAEYAGARRAYIIEEPMAAAIGAGLPVHEPTGNMVVDIGGGTTEVAVISLGGIVTSQSVRIGGDELDEAIVSFVKKEFSLALGERTAEEIKITLGSAYPLEQELHAEIRGRDLVSGLPKTIVVSTEEIRRAIEEPVSAIIDAVKVTLDRTPPELAADIMEQGIVLTGGGALLHGLESRLQHETGMPIVVARDPLNCVADRQRPVPGGVRSAEAGADHHLHALIDRPVSPGWPRSRRSRRTLTVIVLVVAVAVADLPRSQRADPQPDVGHQVGGQRRLLAVAPGRGRHHRPDRELLRRRVQLRRRCRRRTSSCSGRSASCEPRRAEKGFEENQLRELTALQNLPFLQSLPTVTAQTQDEYSSNFTATITLDKGRADGVDVGFPVVGAGGLVGQVIQSFHHTSRRAPHHRRPVQGRGHLRSGQPVHRDRRRPGSRELD